MTVTERSAPAEPQEDPFWRWLERRTVRLAVKRQHDQWYAIAPDFDLAGVGVSEDAAALDALRATYSYLRQHHRAGHTYREALRPVPFRVRFAIACGTLLYRVLRSRAPRPFATDEARFYMPQALNGHSAQL